MLVVFVVIKTIGYAQSESHDFVTKDSLLAWPENAWSTHLCPFRIMRPLSGPPRPTIIMIPGQMQMRLKTDLSKTITPTDTTRLTTFGPAAFIPKYWDGSVKLGNGTHYPVIITLTTWTQEGFDAGTLDWLLTTLIKQYPCIDTNNLFLTGLSQGAMVSTAYVCRPYRWVKGVRAIACFSGATPDATGNFSGFSPWNKLGGKGFFTVYPGDNNSVNPPLVAYGMNASFPGSAYFSYNNQGSTTSPHCCWNTFYNPVTNQLWNGPYTATGTYANVQGTYKNGSNIYQWFLRQGDTALIGSPIVQPPINVPPVAALTYTVPSITPVTYIVLDGSKSYDTDGTIDSTWLTQVSGPNQAFMVTSVCDVKGVACGLIPGTYVFQLKVKDNKGSTGTSLAQITIAAPPKSVVLTVPISLTFLGSTIIKTLVVYNDGTYIVQ